MKAYAVITGRLRYDLELQIVVYSEAQAKKEVNDLRKNYGIDDARFKEFESEEKLYEWHAKVM